MSFPNRNTIDRTGVGTAGVLAALGAVDTVRTANWSKKTPVEKVASATWTSLQALAAYAAISTALSGLSKK